MKEVFQKQGEEKEIKKQIENAKNVLKSDVVGGLRLLCGIPFLSKTQLEEAYALSKTILVIDSKNAHSKSFLLCKLVENRFAPKDIINSCFQDLISMLESENQEIVDAAFSSIHYSLTGFEQEKYSLLHIYLNGTNKIAVLRDFFYHFHDPRYIFDIMVRMYEVQGFRLSMSLFTNTIEHFWSSATVETETQILNLFSQKEFGMLAIKIMTSPSSYTYPVDLLKLTSKDEQKNAIECICRYPHSIDTLLPILLKLRTSTHKEVKAFLQSKLAELVFETYHSSLLKLIEKEITSSAADKKFIAPLKKALQAYNVMKEFKNGVKDINPWENEKDLIDLYYRLEHETQAVMMKDSQKDSSFLSMLKNTTIVRGNAWKHEDDDLVRPLAHIQTSTLIDSRAYKNPLAYEQELENF